MTRRTGKPWAQQNRAEDALQEATADYMAALPPSVIATPFVAIHIPNEGRRGKAEMGKLMRMGFRPGAADWVLTWAGGSAWIELKVGTRKQTENQLGFEAECQQKRIPYFVVRTLECFEMRLVGLGLTTRPILCHRRAI